MSGLAEWLDTTSASQDSCEVKVGQDLHNISLNADISAIQPRYRDQACNANILARHRDRSTGREDADSAWTHNQGIVSCNSPRGNPISLVLEVTRLLFWEAVSFSYY